MIEMKEVDVTTINGENLIRRRGRPMVRLRLLGLLVLLILAAWAIWSWGFCRFYVGPGKMAIITSKIGKALPSDQILARPGQKGVQAEVLGEGRHIWNPLFYDWEIRDAILIRPGQVGVVTSLEGDNLPPGEFLAEPGQKGTWRKVLGPGLYRLNPYGYKIDIIDAVSIPLGFAGVVTNQSGGEAAERSFSEAGQRGIRADVLQPGLYYINPRQYKVEALEVGVNQVSLMGQDGGVILTKSVMDENNQMIQRLNQNVLEEQKRRRVEQSIESAAVASRQREPLPQAEYAADDADVYAMSVDIAEEIMNDPGRAVRREARKLAVPAAQAPSPSRGRVVTMERDVPPEFILKQYVNFPSRDAFNIMLDMTVEFELQPGDLAGIRAKIGDLPEVVSKKIMPGILSLSRTKGSEYRAVDFIAGVGREKFQNELTDALKFAMAEDNVLIHSALISNVTVPDQILEPLRTTSLSRETDLTNKEKQNTAKKQADLNREMSLIRRSGEQVAQETDKMKAQIAAERERTVATIQAETGRKVAAIDKETAEVRATRTVALGRANAESIRMVEEEKARGFGMKVRAFSRDGGDYALYEFAMGLNPDLRINLIHAGEGTLWTDLKSPTFAEMGAAAGLKK